MISLNIRNYFKIIFVVSFFVLVSAYTLELFFNFLPCKLCVYQRIPYFLLLVLSLVFFVYPLYRFFIYLSLGFLVSSFSISVFHSMVERKLVNFDIGCTSIENDFSNIENRVVNYDRVMLDRR